jgi:hypothetical protein
MTNNRESYRFRMYEITGLFSLLDSLELARKSVICFNVSFLASTLLVSFINIHRVNNTFTDLTGKKNSTSVHFKRQRA